MQPPTRKPGIGKGVLDRKAAAGVFEIARYEPEADLAPFVEHYWTVRWNRGEAPPHVQETLPYPAVHVVLEAGRSEVVGVVTGKFERVLEGQGSVFAVKMRPAGFHGFLGRPVADITDRRPSLGEVFDVDVGALEREVFGAADDGPRVAALGDLLRRHVPDPDPMVDRVNAVVERVASERDITSAAMLAERAGMSVRTLQRAFHRYVGVGPKWVIRRNRLQDAVELLGGDGELDLAALAAELGYADQAHFIRDFRQLVGAPPGAYARRAR